MSRAAGQILAWLVFLALLVAGCSSTVTTAATPTPVAPAATPTAAVVAANPAATPTTRTTPATSAAATASVSARPTGTTAATVAPTAAAAGTVPAPTTAPTSASTAAAADDWPTYHRDNARTGVAPGTKTFARASEAWRSDTLDGEVYAEPLVVGGRVLVATENNTIYSFDAGTGKLTWSVHLGEPVQRSQLPCGDITVTGITSTPVVDVAKGVLYAVTFVQPGRHELAALDLATGAVRFRQANDPPGADPLTQQQRSALVLAGGQVYVAYGGLFGDCGAYHGWVVAASAADGSQHSTYQVPTQREGGIWAPSGPAVDAAGNVYVATGNGSSTNAATFDFGNAVLRLSPDLHLLDWFAPTEWAQLNRSDADIGSLGPSLLDGGLLFQIGKSGVGYLLRTDQLGHEGGQAFSGSVCRSAFGGAAYAASVIYVPCSDGLVALQVDNKPAFSVLWRLPGLFAGPPIVAGGAVWTIGRDGTLDALDPRSGQTRFHTNIGTSTHFATPSASGGRLFVPAATQILAFNLE